MQTIAHRGGRVELFQENSYEIIHDFFANYHEIKNSKYKFDGLEFDIVELKNGEFLLLHSKKEGKRLSGKNIDLNKMSREDIKNTKIQKYIEKSHLYDKDRNYDKEANFIFLDEVFDLYSKYRCNNNIILVLDIKSISSKGCKKLKNLLDMYKIPLDSIKISVYGFLTSYHINKHFSNVYKEWFPIIDTYSTLPYCIERIYNIIMYHFIRNWNAISIALYKDYIVDEQLKFRRKGFQISYFGLTNEQKENLIEIELKNKTNNISYFCIDSDV
jgi:hypothetical protein